MCQDLNLPPDPFLCSVIENAATGILVLNAPDNTAHDIDSYSIAFVNCAACGFLHQTIESLIGQPLSYGLTPLHHPHAIAALATVLDSPLGSTAERVEVPDGRGSILEFAISRTEYGLSVIIFDVTERVQREKIVHAALTNSENRLRTVLANAPAALFQVKRDAQGLVRFDFTSAAFAELHNLPLYNAPTVLEDVLPCLAEDDQAEIAHSIGQALKSTSDWNGVYRVTSDRTPSRWLQATARVAKRTEAETIWTGVCVDVTAMKQAEERLQASETKFRAMFDSSVVGKWVHRNFRPLAINKSLAHMLGFSSPDEMMRESDLRALMGDEMRQSVEEAWIGLLSHNAQFYRRRLHLLTRTGRDVWVEAISTLLDWDGQPAMHEVMVNVTAEVEKEQALALARAETETALLAKSQFLAAISHELRTPMNAIMTMSDLLAELHPTSAQADCLALLQQGSQQMMSLIDSILDFDRLDMGRMELTPRSTRLQDVFELLRQSMQPRAHAKQLDFHVEPESLGEIEVWVDQGRFYQVLQQIVANAIKFTDKGGVCVHASAEQNNHGDVRLRVEVRDTGMGLPEHELRDKLFEGFVQADTTIRRKHGGLGLGLAICRKIIDLMGGRIGASTQQGEGSTFWIECTLPQVKSNAAALRGAA